MVTENRFNALGQLKNVKKFVPDETILYPGATSEGSRLRLEHRINVLIDRLLATDVESLDKQAVLSEFKIILKESDMEDSEDRDRICFYLGSIMDIFQIDSSDGLLNTWRYGFNPDEIRRKEK